LGGESLGAEGLGAEGGFHRDPDVTEKLRILTSVKRSKIPNNLCKQFGCDLELNM
jgi:hypothetical protein